MSHTVRNGGYFATGPLLITFIAQDLDSLRMEQLNLTQKIRQLGSGGPSPASSHSNLSGLPPRGDDGDSGKYPRSKRYRDERRQRSDRGFVASVVALRHNRF